MNSLPSATPTARDHRVRSLFVSIFLLAICAPWGLRRLWKRGTRWWVLLPAAIITLPVFVVTCAFIGILAFASFLPDLDLSVSEHAPRTVRFAAGNYESTFLETSRDTGGVRELIRVEIQPHGGNEFHYHRTFEETFTAVDGELTVFVGSKVTVLKPGESITAPRGILHTFRNATDKLVTMTVRVEPARGLEKSIRVAYGLSNTNRWYGASRMKNTWRLVLMLAYSETYMPGMPGFIQEPLVGALARIAQWRGEDAELQEFFGPPQSAGANVAAPAS